MTKIEKQRLELSAPEYANCDLDLHSFCREFKWHLHKSNNNIRMSIGLEKINNEEKDPKMSMMFKSIQTGSHVTYNFRLDYRLEANACRIGWG